MSRMVWRLETWKEGTDWYPAIWCFRSFVGFHVSQFHRPLVVEFLLMGGEKKNESRDKSNNSLRASKVLKRVHFCTTNLLFGHVQQAHWVPLAVQVDSHGVERLVELSLDVSQLLKDFTGRPEKHLRSRTDGEVWLQWAGGLLSGTKGSRVVMLYLTSSGLHVEHVVCVMLQHDDLSKVHVLVKELKRKRQSLVSAQNHILATK